MALARSLNVRSQKIASRTRSVDQPTGARMAVGLLRTAKTQTTYAMQDVASLAAKTTPHVSG